MLEQLIKNKVRQSLLEHSMLVENYATNQELIKLCQEFMGFMFKIWVRNREFDIAHKIYSRDFINPDNYEVLNEFLKDSQISLEFSESLNAKGQIHRHSDPNRKKYSITIRIMEYDIERINKEVMDIDMDDLESAQYWSTNQYESTLVHELQHAYDAWRSKGKFDRDQYTPNYKTKEKMALYTSFKDSEKRNEKDMEHLQRYQNAYLNLTHEINARFAQTMKDLKIWDYVDQDWGYTKEIVDWKRYLDEFKMYFVGWESLKEGVKKNLIRRLSKVYADASEDFKNKKD